MKNVSEWIRDAETALNTATEAVSRVEAGPVDAVLVNHERALKVLAALSEWDELDFATYQIMLDGLVKGEK